MNQAQLLELMSQHPELRTPFEEVKAKLTLQYQAYDDFLKRLMSDIDWIIAKLESGKPYYQGQSEDKITLEIVHLLQAKGYNASHGNFSSGETDIYVTYGPYEWIGEAKKHHSDDNVKEGMLQLCTRYSDGGQNKCHGGLIIYNFTNNLREKIQRMKDYWANDCDDHKEIRVEDCPLSSAAFITVHIHDSSGDDYAVRHRWVNLYHNPKDKSARGRKGS